jgi:hypothetical protein
VMRPASDTIRMRHTKNVEGTKLVLYQATQRAAKPITDRADVKVNYQRIIGGSELV